MKKMNNRGLDLTMLAVFAVLAAAMLLYFMPGYKQIESKTRYPDFHGLSPESHLIRDGVLEATLKNSFSQPLVLNRASSKIACTFENATIQPSKTLNITCGEFNGNLTLSYTVSGMRIDVSGSIPAN